ncbi:S9 family peptidase [Pseudidiomarina sp. CB1]|uniref:alpha/beta hydrolase family protein n=1 Tax=Pseudidiomarina sp. CB1 TaxID=2972484 RepID=UPI002162E540|nr:alpha/beta hydrolase [Pseudidiomarina sp. CB1]
MKKLSAYHITASVLLFALVSLSPAAAAILDPTAHDAQPRRSNVSFNDVLKVPFSKPDQRNYYGEAPIQFVERWQTSKDQSSTPVIISIHGGCWLNAYAIDHTYAMNSALREAGFEVWALEYRRVGDTGGGWPGTFIDVQQGLARIVAEFGGEQAFAQRDVTLMGHSAGGHLALLAAQQNTQLVDRVVGLAAITNLHTYAQGENGCQQAGKSFMEGADAAAWQAANPATMAPAQSVYLFHGDADSIVPPQQSRTYAKHDNVHLQWLAGAGHFDVIDPQSHAWLTIVTQLKELSAQN